MAWMDNCVELVKSRFRVTSTRYAECCVFGSLRVKASMNRLIVLEISFIFHPRQTTTAVEHPTWLVTGLRPEVQPRALDRNQILLTFRNFGQNPMGQKCLKESGFSGLIKHITFRLESFCKRSVRFVILDWRQEKKVLILSINVFQLLIPELVL